MSLNMHAPAFTTLVLKRGAHSRRDHGMCVLEAVAYVAGEPHSDEPACACRVISEFLRSWNDALPDDETRTRLLRPLVPLVVGSRSTPEVQERRAFLALDWSVRVSTPAWLRLAGLAEHAVALEGLPEVRTAADARAAQPELDAARDAARDAAWDAAGDSAWAAAWTAAGDAAWAAAQAAAWDAAWDAAFDAARDSAWDAARDAARAAARDALAPTVANLQASARGLVHRMLAVKEGAS